MSALACAARVIRFSEPGVSTDFHLIEDIMPRRLLLAADILRDVAREVNAADRPLLEAAADELAERAAALLADEGLDREPTPRLEPIGMRANSCDTGVYRPVAQLVN